MRLCTGLAQMCETIIAFLCCFSTAEQDRDGLSHGTRREQQGRSSNGMRELTPATDDASSSSRLLHSTPLPNEALATRSAGSASGRHKGDQAVKPRHHEAQQAYDQRRKPPNDLMHPEAMQQHGKPTAIDPLFDEDDECCTACLEEYDCENPAIKLQCGHHFHLGCVLQWAERSRTCPICASPLTGEIFDM